MRTSLGLLLVSVVIAVTACASGQPAAPPSVNVTGQWVGSWAYEMPSSGYLTVTGNQMSGKVNGMNVANVTPRKQ